MIPKHLYCIVIKSAENHLCPEWKAGMFVSPYDGTYGMTFELQPEGEVSGFTDLSVAEKYIKDIKDRFCKIEFEVLIYNKF